MNIHIALYKWKKTARTVEINRALKIIKALEHKVPGILDIMTGVNNSKYNQGYTHVILVRARNEAAIQAYRHHPDHILAAASIESMEDNGIGVDFTDQ